MAGIVYTVVVPAYKECGNLEPLISQVFDALEQQGMRDSTEMIIVDDNSNDGSVEIVEEMKRKGYNTRIIVRTKERGLSSAVMRGFEEAAGSNLLCMDADLQHPPTKVPELLRALSDGAEFVIGTRYGEGCAIDENWPVHRRVISSTARLMARPLTPLSDPMTGFFGIRKDKYQNAKNVNSIGFKICMELYVKAGIRQHREVPFLFGVRNEGESKLTGAVIVHYLLHLKDLYLFRYPIAFPVVVVAAVLFALYVFWCVLSLIF